MIEINSFLKMVDDKQHIGRTGMLYYKEKTANQLCLMEIGILRKEVKYFIFEGWDWLDAENPDCTKKIPVLTDTRIELIYIKERKDVEETINENEKP